MRIRNYYKQDHVSDGIDKNVLEKRFGDDIEPRTRNIINKIIHTPEEITETCNAYIVTYLVNQHR